MPLPIVHQKSGVSPRVKKSFRVFVSYSHNDTKDSELFIRFFHRQLEATPQLGITQEHVFYDRAHLKAGDEWHESIQCALDESDYFIFLISINSLSSSYCLTRELSSAAKRGLPILQILLSPCPWEWLPVPDDNRNRTLGVFGALPKDDNFSLRPISAWAENNRAEAWNRVVQDLTSRMLRDEVEPFPQNLMVEPVERAQMPKGVVPLLPYLCNQVEIVNRFNNRIRAWGNQGEHPRTLTVLLRGLADDNVPRFCSLLRSKYLKDWATIRNEQLLEPRPFIWPIAPNRTLDMEEGAADMMSALSESLTGNSFRLTNSIMLAEWLAGLHGILPIVTTLPKGSKKNVAAGLQILLNLFEACPSKASLDRLVIFIIIENEGLISEKELSKSLRLVSQSAHLVDLMPLQEIDEHDVRSWYRSHVERIYPINEEELMKKVFIDDLVYRLRMGPFDARVRPMLRF